MCDKMAKILVTKNKWNSDRYVALLRTQRVGWHHGCVCVIRPYLTCDLVRNVGLGCGCKDYRTTCNRLQVTQSSGYELYKCNL